MANEKILTGDSKKDFGGLNLIITNSFRKGLNFFGQNKSKKDLISEIDSIILQFQNEVFDKNNQFIEVEKNDFLKQKQQLTQNFKTKIEEYNKKYNISLDADKKNSTYKKLIEKFKEINDITYKTEKANNTNQNNEEIIYMNAGENQETTRQEQDAERLKKNPTPPTIILTPSINDKENPIKKTPITKIVYNEKSGYPVQFVEPTDTGNIKILNTENLQGTKFVYQSEEQRLKNDELVNKINNNERNQNKQIQNPQQPMTTFGKTNAFTSKENKNNNQLNALNKRKANQFNTSQDIH